MSTALNEPRAKVGVTAPPRFTSIAALARLEGRRLIFSPLVVAGVVIGSVTFILLTGGAVPVVARDVTYLGLALLPVALGTLFAANLAATRSNRDGTEELYRSLAMEARERTFAHLLSTLGVTTAAIVCAVSGLGYLLLRAGVGTANIAELVTGPTIVLVGGACGVVTARWWPLKAATSILAVGLATAHLYLSVGVVDTYRPPPSERWLALWVAPSLAGDPTIETLIRPSSWHLAYLVALVLTAWVVALLRHGVGIGGLACLLVCLIVVLFTAFVQLRGPTVPQEHQVKSFATAPQRFQTCELHRHVTYCAYSTYTPWIGRWADTVQPILDNVPEDGPLPQVRVRQFPEVRGSDLPGQLQELFTNRWQPGGRDRAARYFPGEQIYTRTSWALGEEGRNQRFALALGVAAWASGLPATTRSFQSTPGLVSQASRLVSPRGRKKITILIERGGVEQCSSAGQARSIVALWLAAQASPETEAVLRTAAHQKKSGLQSFDSAASNIRFTTGAPIVWGQEETRYASQLLDRDRSKVLSELQAHWRLLTRPTTRTHRVVSILKLERTSVSDSASGIRSGLIPCP